MLQFWQRGLKSELVIKFIAVIAITTLISCFVGTLLINKWTMGQAESNVRNALNSARYVLYHRLENILNTVQFSSSQNKLHAALSKGDRAGLQRYLEEVRKEGGLDILNVTDAKGNVMLRAGNPGQSGDNLAGDAVVGRALTSGKAVSSLEAWSREAVAREGRNAESRCSVTSSPSEPAAMVLVAASPIISPEGRVLGGLCVAELLNRNDELVDRIRDVLFQNEKYGGKQVGGATLFLGNVRISTTFTNDDRNRGFGSSLSGEVSPARCSAREVGGSARAPVIHQGYVAAYEALSNMGGQIIEHDSRGYAGAEVRGHADEDNRNIPRHQLIRRGPRHCHGHFLFRLDRQAHQCPRARFAQDRERRFFRARKHTLDGGGGRA